MQNQNTRESHFPSIDNHELTSGVTRVFKSHASLCSLRSIVLVELHTKPCYIVSKIATCMILASSCSTKSFGLLFGLGFKCETLLPCHSFTILACCFCENKDLQNGFWYACFKSILTYIIITIQKQHTSAKLLCSDTKSKWQKANKNKRQCIEYSPVFRNTALNSSCPKKNKTKKKRSRPEHSPWKPYSVMLPE